MINVYAVLAFLAAFLLAPMAQAQDEGLAGAYTVPGAAVEWMAGAVPASPATAQTGNLILTVHVAQTWEETYSEMCMHVTSGQPGATVQLALYALPFASGPTERIWLSDPIDASTSGQKCALLGDDGGTIDYPIGTSFFDSEDRLSLSLLDPLIGRVAKGRVKTGPTGSAAALSERVIGSGRNIGFARPTTGTNVTAYRGFTQATHVPPLVFEGAPSTTIDTPYLPLIP